MNYEIVNIHVKNNEVWAYLLNKDYERLQQLTLIKPLKEIASYLDEKLNEELKKNNIGNN